MNNIDQIQLVRLRPEKFDDRAIKEQIALIQQSCGNDIDPNKIALVFHECDYNMQKTIERIQAGEFEDGEWQTAKPTHKKKLQNHNDFVANGNHINDNERSIRDDQRRLVQKRADFRRNHFNARSSNKVQSSTNTDVPVLNNYQSKRSSIMNSSSTKQKIPSIIPPEPVRMHSTVKYTSQPIDIQFGDIQWNDNIPAVITPSNEQEYVNLSNDDDAAAVVVVVDQQSTNDTDNQFSSSLSITDNTISNTSPNESTSHLSDQLTEPSTSTNINSYPSQPNGPVHIPITRLPPTSTPRIPEYPTNTTSTFSHYPSIARDYSQTINWNTPQTSNYKSNSKTNLLPTTHFPQPTSYQISSQQQQQQQGQQQQIFLGTYPYPAISPAVVQVFAPIEHWSHNGYSAPLESYTYSTTNYIPAYPNQQPYPSQTKYDHQTYDKELYNHQTQSIKDPHLTSKLSPTAVTFSQGAPLTASPSTTALYTYPISFPMANYYPSSNGVSDRDNRHGSSTNRTNYYHHHGQTSRPYNSQVSNSTWHSQQ